MVLFMSEDTKNEEAKTAPDTTPSKTEVVEKTPAPVETKPAESKPAEVKPTEAKTAEVKPTESKPADAKPGFANAKPGNNRSGGDRRPGGPGGQGGPGGNRRGGKRGKGGFNKRQSEFEERMVDLARVTTVTKGGRRFSFSATVVIGNKKGKVAWGHGKANEVPDAIKKAVKDARSRIIEVPIIDSRTVPHEQTSKFLASRVMVKPAPAGKGLIASGAVRAVVELAGYKDIYTKSLGSRSKGNAIKATIKALSELRTVEEVARIRGIKPEEVLG